jgi:hypothetical protein
MGAADIHEHQVLAAEPQAEASMRSEGGYAKARIVVAFQAMAKMCSESMRRVMPHARTMLIAADRGMFSSTMKQKS